MATMSEVLVIGFVSVGCTVFCSVRMPSIRAAYTKVGQNCPCYNDNRTNRMVAQVGVVRKCGARGGCAFPPFASFSIIAGVGLALPGSAHIQSFIVPSSRRRPGSKLGSLAISVKHVSAPPSRRKNFIATGFPLSGGKSSIHLLIPDMPVPRAKRTGSRNLAVGRRSAVADALWRAGVSIK